MGGIQASPPLTRPPMARHAHMEITLRRRQFFEALAIVALGSPTSAAGDCHDFDWLLGHRRMVRRFRSDPIPDRVVRELIDTATRSTRQWLASAGLPTEDSARDRDHTDISTGPLARAATRKHALCGASLPSCSI